MDYQYLLFDLDGTLTDPGEGITNSVAYALAKFGISVSDRTQLYPFIGPPLIDSFMKYYGFSKPDAQRAVEYYREYFRDKGIFENVPYEGIHSVLAELQRRGKTLILATSKPEQFAKRIVKHFDLAPYFHYVAGASMDEKRSEKWDVIRHALDTCNITDLAHTVMIGDRKHDVIGAKKTGLDSVGVLWGYGDTEELQTAGANFLVHSLPDLLDLLR